MALVPNSFGGSFNFNPDEDTLSSTGYRTATPTFQPGTTFNFAPDVATQEKVGIQIPWDQKLQELQQELAAAKTPEARQAIIDQLSAMRPASFNPATPLGMQGQSVFGESNLPTDPEAFKQYFNNWVKEHELEPGTGKLSQQDMQTALAMLGGGNSIAFPSNGTPGSDVVSQLLNSGAQGIGQQYRNDAIYGNIYKNQQINNAINLGNWDSNVNPAYQSLLDKNAAADTAGQTAVQNLTGSRDRYASALDSLSRQLQGAASDTNARSTASVDRLGSTYAGLNASDQSALGSYIGATDPLMAALSARGYGDAVGFDPEGLAAQRQALGNANSIYGGGLNYSSQAAQAFANNADIARQNTALDALLKDMQSGGQNQQEVLDKARQELATGGDRQRAVYDKYWAQSTPEITAQERLNAEIARRNFEGQDQSNREALYQNLKQRGLNSGTLQVAQNQAAQERLGQDRTLAEMALQSQAVQRALQALAGAGTTATQLRSGDQNALSIMGSAANSLRAGNQASAKNYYDSSSDMRKQGFTEAYDRGLASDEASANNQRTMLGGAQLGAQQSNAIRNANDAINMFNKEQSQITQRFQDQYAQNEAERVGNLANQRLTGTLNVNTGIGNRATSLNSATQDSLAGNFGRTNTAVTNSEQNANNIWGADQTLEGTRISTANDAANRASSGLQSAESVTNGRAATLTAGQDAIDKALKALGTVQDEKDAVSG